MKKSIIAMLIIFLLCNCSNDETKKLRSATLPSLSGGESSSIAASLTVVAGLDGSVEYQMYSMENQPKNKHG